MEHTLAPCPRAARFRAGSRLHRRPWRGGVAHPRSTAGVLGHPGGSVAVPVQVGERRDGVSDALRRIQLVVAPLARPRCCPGTAGSRSRPLIACSGRARRSARPGPAARHGPRQARHQASATAAPAIRADELAQPLAVEGRMPPVRVREVDQDRRAPARCASCPDGSRRARALPADRSRPESSISPGSRASSVRGGGPLGRVRRAPASPSSRAAQPFRQVPRRPVRDHRRLRWRPRRRAAPAPPTQRSTTARIRLCVGVPRILRRVRA